MLLKYSEVDEEQHLSGYLNKHRKDVFKVESKEKLTPVDTAKANQITGFQLFSMTTSMVMTVYGFAAFAKQGPTALFFLFLAGILWFLPVTRLPEKWRRLMDGVKEESLLGLEQCWTRRQAGPLYFINGFISLLV